MENLGLYTKLTSKPLFTGMSRDELERIVTQTRFDFIKAAPGRPIVAEGDRCGRLLLLVDGLMEAVTTADDRGYAVSEQLRAPFTLQPELVFGLSQRHTSTFAALTPCSLISIDKNETLRLTASSLILRLNLLNLLSTALQKQRHTPWRSLPHDLDHRVRRFFADHCLYPGGPKVFHIKMRRLAADLNDTRLRVSQVLNALQADGLLTLGRSRIVVPSMEALVG